MLAQCSPLYAYENHPDAMANAMADLVRMVGKYRTYVAPSEGEARTAGNIREWLLTELTDYYVRADLEDPVHRALATMQEFQVRNHMPRHLDRVVTTAAGWPSLDETDDLWRESAWREVASA